VQSGLGRRSRLRVALGGVGLAALVLASLLPGVARPHTTYVIGAKTFTEQYVLAALIDQRLRTAGLSAERREGLGSSVIFNALADNQIDVYVDYSGTLWANQLKHNDVQTRAAVLTEVSAWLHETKGALLLGSLGFENAYALAMSRKKAEALGIRSLTDLARHAPQLSIAGDYEFFVRPEWTALRKAYGFNFREERQMQPDFMYAAAGNGDVDVISAYTSEGRIAQFDLVVLEDTKHAIPPYDAILLVAPKRAKDAALLDALRPLIGGIDVKLMQAANLRASSGQASADETARWLSDQIRK